MKRILQWILYPIIMCLAGLQFFLILRMGPQYLETATTVPLLFGILACVILERYLPYNTQWKPVSSDWKIDTAFLFIFQTIFPKIFKYVVLLLVLHFIPDHITRFAGIWPQHWPILAQALLMMFISDLFRYWVHRLSHTVQFLWRFHAVHHSLDKLYWLNTTRIHPIEKFLQLCVEVAPFLLIGVSKEVIALHLVIYGVNGFIRHSNIYLKYGALNYIISTNELHRWHHSKLIHESNSNYGSDTMIWDIVFRSFFWPKDREVEELGVFNANYPRTFNGQLTAPIVADLDKQDKLPFSWELLLLNSLMRLKMYVNRSKVQRYLDQSKDVQGVQERLLLQLIEQNKHTAFGKAHHFDSIKNYDDFSKNVPVAEYENLRPWIEEQAAKLDEPILMSDRIEMFNQTSGSTAKPKMIPVTKQVMHLLQQSQEVSSYLQYQYCPEGFAGRILGVVSPAIERYENGIPVGSASGHFYKNMPSIVKRKYVVPHTVFEIKEYDLKYYIILLLGLQHRDVTYLGTANSTTFLKLNEMLNKHRARLLLELKEGKLSEEHVLEEKIRDRVNSLLKPTAQRLKELELLFLQDTISLKQVWPHLKLVATWVWGSCGVALKAARPFFPDNVKVLDLGFIASEFRGTVNVDYPNQAGMPTMHAHFFEFVAKDDWENGNKNFKRLHELQLGESYYVFFTGANGLYRYNMNDIMRVVNFLNDCPLLVFHQKGNGICNITGEKLYESQLLEVLDSFHWQMVYFQALADEENAQYVGYVEWSNIPSEDVTLLEKQFDEALCKLNVEYAEKRAGGRLKSFKLVVMKPGTYNSVKEQALKSGMIEGQFKTILLQYKSKFKWNLEL
jgi:sterol desaturase/sphingolipid hydroxylase (fatty acid hydroxylase superfamily)